MTRKVQSGILIGVLVLSIFFVVRTLFQGVTSVGAAVGGGLVGYWRFDEGSGTMAYDSSGNGNNGTLMNNPTWVDGIYGKALSFDGIDDYVEIPFSESLKLENFTLMAFCKPKSVQTVWSHLIGIGVGDNAINLAVNSHSSPNKPFGHFKDNYSSDHFIYSPENFQPEVWQMWAFTYNGSAMRLYRNDTLVKEIPIAVTTITYSTAIHIATRSLAEQEAFNGIIDEVKVFNRALSAEEIAEDYGGLVGYWKFDEGSGTTAHDDSEFGNNGTLVNGPLWADGRYGKALMFDSISEYVNVPDSDSLDIGTSDFSLLAWVNHTGPSGGTGAILSKTLLDGSTGYFFGISNDGRIYFEFHSAANHVSGFSVSAFPLHQWHHVAITFERMGNATFYLDGTYAGTKDISGVTGNLSNNRPLTIGNSENYQNNNQFFGTIDEVRIYDRMLGEEEIRFAMSPHNILVPDDYPTIQNAINNADNGDTIHVRSGVYSENIVVNKTLQLEGDGSGTTVIDGGTAWFTVEVTATNVIVKGFTIRSTGGGSNGISIASGSSSNCIAGNTIANYSGTGMMLREGSSYNRIIGNNITNNEWHGIMLDAKNDYNLISNNQIANQQHYGIFFYGLSYTNCSNYNKIINNTITNNGVGVYLCYGSPTFNEIRGNAVVYDSVDLRIAFNNTVSENRFIYSILYLDRSAFNTVTENNMSSSTFRTYNSWGNNIYHNNLTGLPQVTNSTDIWDNGYPSGGNRWGDYTGLDQHWGPSQNELGSDGIGDTPYIIDANNTDNYPIMIWPILHDIAVTSLHHMKTGCVPAEVVCYGMLMSIYVKVENQGSIAETINIALYANVTQFEVKTIIVILSQAADLTFIWDTTDLAEYGRYDFNSVATLMTDINPSDNTLEDGWVRVVHMGDITGDGKVDTADLARVSGAFGSLRVANSSDPEYGKYRHPMSCVTCSHEPNTDVTGDSKVDIADLSRTSANFGWHR